MSLLTRPVEKLLRYILTRLHAGILLGELDHKHLEASVIDGVYVLKNLELNPQTINSELAESPIHLTSAICHRSIRQAFTTVTPQNHRRSYPCKDCQCKE